MKYILLSFFISSWAQAWTLNNNFSAAFKDSEVKVYVASNTTCSKVLSPSETMYDFQDLIKPAIDEYWNTVPTSALRLKDGGFSSDAVPNINNGALCSPTDKDCISTAGSALIPKVKDIIIACNDKPENFGGNNVLAVTIPNSFSGKKITGAVILINNYSTSPNYFARLSRKDKIAVIAHEIGHAIGLGHSDDKDALMYYRTVNQRDRLGQDDMDGVSFLYPMQVDAFGLLKGGLLGGCGTIIMNNNEPPKDPPFSQMGITLAVVVLVGEFARLLRSRSKARSAA